MTVANPLQNQSMSMFTQPRTLNTINAQNPMSGASFSQGIAASGMQVSGLQQTPLNYASLQTMIPRQVSQMSYITNQRQMAVVAAPVVAAPVAIAPVVAAPVAVAPVAAAPVAAAPVVVAPVAAAPVAAPVVAAPLAAPAVALPAASALLPNAITHPNLASMAAALHIPDLENTQNLKEKLAHKDRQVNILIGLLSKQIMSDVAKSPILAGITGAPPATVTAPGPVLAAPAPVVAAPVAAAPVVAAPVAAAPVVTAPAQPIIRTLEKQQSERDLTEQGRHFPGVKYVFQRRS